MDRRKVFLALFLVARGSVGDPRVSSYGIPKSQPLPGYAGLPSEHSVAPLLEWPEPARCLSERFADPALPSVTGLRQQRGDGLRAILVLPRRAIRATWIDLWATSHVFLPGHRARTPGDFFQQLPTLRPVSNPFPSSARSTTVAFVRGEHGRGKPQRQFPLISRRALQSPRS